MELFSIKDLVNKTGVCRSTIEKIIKSQNLKPAKKDGKWNLYDYNAFLTISFNTPEPRPKSLKVDPVDEVLQQYETPQTLQDRVKQLEETVARQERNLNRLRVVLEALSRKN